MGKTYLTNQINNSATIVEKAGADIADVRGLILKYDGSGDVIPCSVAGELAVGVGIITNSENIKKGEDVDMQVKDIGLFRSGGAISKGAEIMANTDGKAVSAAGGKFVIGTALEDAVSGQLFFAQITKYYKPA